MKPLRLPLPKERTLSETAYVENLDYIIPNQIYSNNMYFQQCLSISYSDGWLMAFPCSLSLAMVSFMASFLFLLAKTFAWTPLRLGSCFSWGGGGGGLLAALALWLPELNPSTAPSKPKLMFLQQEPHQTSNAVFDEQNPRHTLCAFTLHSSLVA